MGIGIQLDPNGTSFTLSVLDANNQPLASAAFASAAELKAFADYLETQAGIASAKAANAAAAGFVPTAKSQPGVQTFGLLDGVLGGGGPFGGLFPHPPWGGGYPGQWGGGGYYPPYPQYPSQPVIVAPQQPVYVPQPAPQPVVVQQPVYQPAPQPVVVQQPVYQPIPVQAPVVVERPVWRGGPIWGR